MDFTITSQQIVWICGFIASIWGVVKIIKELKKPSDDLKATVKRHDELLHKDNERLNSLEKITLNQEGINKKLEEHTRILSIMMVDWMKIKKEVICYLRQTLQS